MQKDEIGDKFEYFILLKILNQGKYGYVAKVKSKLNNKIYAMKKIDLKLIDNEEKKKYYQNEYDLLKELKPNHENVYKALSLFQENEIIYIITEYMDCGDLYDLFYWNKNNNENNKNNGNIQAISEKRLSKIFVQLFQGLYYIHNELKLIHRGIKLDNIIIDSNDRIKIINFKYAIKKEENDNKKVNIGVFTAPEIKRGNYDEKVDVYSLGMLFNSLTYFSDKPPKGMGNYSYIIYNSIKRMINPDPKERCALKEIYDEFKNKNYNLMKACLKCFIFNHFEYLIKLLNDQINNELVELSLNYKHKNKNFNDDLNIKSIEIEQKFYENDYTINDLTPQNITNFFWSLIPSAHRINDNDIFNILQISSKCSCNAENSSIKQKCFIEFNEEEIKDKKNKINELFKQPIKKMEKCIHNQKNEEMKISTEYINLAKNLIIFIKPSINYSELDIKNIYKLELGEKEGFKRKYSYELNSIIISNNDNFDYFIKYPDREKFENEERAKFNNGNIIALYYKNTIDTNNINIINQSSTGESSTINDNNINNQNLIHNNGINNIPIMNNFFSQGNNNNFNNNNIFNMNLPQNNQNNNNNLNFNNNNFQQNNNGPMPNNNNLMQNNFVDNNNNHNNNQIQPNNQVSGGDQVDHLKDKPIRD